MNGHGKLPMMRYLIKSGCRSDTKYSISPFIVCKENSSHLWRRRAWQHLLCTPLYCFTLSINRHVLQFSSEVTLDLLRTDTLQGTGTSTPGPEIEPTSPALAGGFLPTVPPWKSRYSTYFLIKNIFFAVELYEYFIPSNGEGNGTPLQYSCLENPMDGGAWWAAVHGVAKKCSCLENPRDGGALVGCCLWGRTESDTTEAT